MLCKASNGSKSLCSRGVLMRLGGPDSLNLSPVVPLPLEIPSMALLEILAGPSPRLAEAFLVAAFRHSAEIFVCRSTQNLVIDIDPKLRLLQYPVSIPSVLNKRLINSGSSSAVRMKCRSLSCPNRRRTWKKGQFPQHNPCRHGLSAHTRKLATATKGDGLRWLRMQKTSQEWP